jgi:hypothetical protein
MKKFAVLLTLLLAVGAIYCTTLPEFTVFRLESTIAKRDVKDFEQYADLKTISHNLIQDQVNKPLSGLFGGSGVGDWLNKTITGAVGPTLEENLEQEIRSAIYDGAFNADHPGNTSLLTVYRLQKQLGFDEFTYSGMSYRERSVTGTKAVLSLAYRRPKDGFELFVKVELTRGEGLWSWQVSRILEPGTIIDNLESHPIQP